MTVATVMIILGVILVTITVVGIYLLIKRLIKYNSEVKNGKTKRQTELEKMKIDDLH